MRSSFHPSPNDTCHVYKLTDRQRHDIHSASSGEFKVEVEGLYIIILFFRRATVTAIRKTRIYMYTQKQKLLLNRSHLKKNVFVLFTVSTQEYIPRAYKYYELEECQNVFVSILYDIKFMYLVCS